MTADHESEVRRDISRAAGAIAPRAGTADAATPKPEAAREGIVLSALRNAQLLGPAFVLIILIAVFAIATPDTFFTLRNLQSILQQNADMAILGVGLTLVLILGEIDLSFPGIVMVTAATVGLSFAGTKVGLPFVGAISMGAGSAVVGTVIALFIGLLLGCISGLLVGRAKVPSFIGSLAGLLLSEGLAYYWLNGQSAFNFPSWVLTLGQGSSAGIPNIAICAVVVAILVHLLLSRTILGRYIYMIGASRTAARLSGVNVTLIVVLVFALSGLISGIAGVAYAGNLGSVNGTSGTELLLPTFAAVVLGGNSLLGGSGGIKNTVVGVLIYSVLENGLLLLNMNVFLRPLMEGIVLVIAVVLNVILSRLASRASLTFERRRVAAAELAPSVS